MELCASHKYRCPRKSTLTSAYKLGASEYSSARASADAPRRQARMSWRRDSFSPAPWVSPVTSMFAVYLAACQFAALVMPAPGRGAARGQGLTGFPFPFCSEFGER